MLVKVIKYVRKLSAKYSRLSKSINSNGKKRIKKYESYFKEISVSAIKIII